MSHSSSSPYVAQVALLVRLPRQQDFFDYLVPSELAKMLQVGTLVEAPFRNTSKRGIVISIKRSSKFTNLKTLNKILAQQIITRQQLLLIKKMSDHYAVSLSSALLLALPVLPTNKFKPFIKTETTPKTELIKRSSTWLLVYHHQLNKTMFLLKMIDRVVKRSQQILILIPEIRFGTSWLTNLKDQAVVWHSELKVSEQQIAWQKIASGQTLVIVGTRSSLFLPFTNLGGIIVDQEEDENYKQFDQNPRYDSIEVAGWLKAIHHCSLALVSTAPRLEDWWKSSNGVFKQRVIDNAVTQSLLKIIDLKDEQKKGNRSFLSDELEQSITQSIKKCKKVFLYLNRRGSHTAVICQDCGKLASCDQCRKPTVWHSSLGKLLCHHCNIMNPLPIPCSQCRGTNLHFIGTGTAELEKKLSQKYQTRTILRIDKDTASSLTPKKIQQADIVLGTAMAWQYINLADFELIGVVLIDGELAIPEFRAGEQIWALLRRILAHKPNQLYIQTYHPEIPALKYLRTNWRSFFTDLLKERKIFNWPPYIELIRLTTRAETERLALNKIQRVYRLLEQMFKRDSRVQISKPYRDLYILVRGNYTYHLLLKYQRGFNPKALWSELPNDVIIDRHPRYILS
ncbi:MAG: primosomal protein N' [Patescibacteria group bacterium]